MPRKAEAASGRACATMTGSLEPVGGEVGGSTVRVHAPAVVVPSESGGLATRMGSTVSSLGLTPFRQFGRNITTVESRFAIEA